MSHMQRTAQAGPVQGLSESSGPLGGAKVAAKLPEPLGLPACACRLLPALPAAGRRPPGADLA
jgi:hypothetical protein